jgi:hypothetical protein
VTAASVAAQVAGIAPGGVGTYEAAAVAAYAALGFPTGPALAAALVTHAMTTSYALAAGAVALFLPRPGLLTFARPLRRAAPHGRSIRRRLPGVPSGRRARRSRKDAAESSVLPAPLVSAWQDFELPTF